MTEEGEEVGMWRGGGERGLSKETRPLEALLNRASAWEMESRDGAVKSSSRESDRQMGSEGEEEGGQRLVTRDGLEAMGKGGLWLHVPSWRIGHTGLDSVGESVKNYS